MKVRLSFSQTWTVVLSWLALVTSALAHDPGLSTVTVHLRPKSIQVALVLSLKDAVLLTSGAPNPSKVESSAREALEMTFDGRPGKAEQIRAHLDDKGNTTIDFQFARSEFTNLSVRSLWLAQLPPGHRQFVRIQHTDGAVLAEKLLSASADSMAVELKGATAGSPSPEHSFADFLLLGMKHILTGYDHLLFLLSLLIVTRRMIPALKIITAFTVAHSITLALAVLDVIHIPSTIVEPFIAASIIYVGLENLLRGENSKGRVPLTFAFGLVHGLGFASALREAGLESGGGIAIPLISFNAGVELGQLLVAAAFLPVIVKMVGHPRLSMRLVPACSAAVALTGAGWLVQRIWFT